MPLHAVGASFFELWRGEPPRFHQQSVATFARPGVEGTAVKLTAKRGAEFTAELESWFRSYALAMRQLQRYLNLIGSNPQRVVYNGQDYVALYKTRYQVLDVQEVDCRVNVRLVGPRINYASGASLVTRWRMVPIFEPT